MNTTTHPMMAAVMQTGLAMLEEHEGRMTVSELVDAGAASSRTVFYRV